MGRKKKNDATTIKGRVKTQLAPVPKTVGPRGQKLDWGGIAKTEFVRGMLAEEWTSFASYARAKGVSIKSTERNGLKHRWMDAVRQARESVQEKALSKLEDEIASIHAEMRKKHLKTAGLLHSVGLKGLTRKREDGTVELVNVTASEGIRAARAAVQIERDTLGLSSTEEVKEDTLSEEPEEVLSIKKMTPEQRQAKIRELRGIIDAKQAESNT